MSEMLIQLGLLAVAIICNILCGIYYNINIKEANFDWYKLSSMVLDVLHHRLGQNRERKCKE